MHPPFAFRRIAAACALSIAWLAAAGPARAADAAFARELDAYWQDVLRLEPRRALELGDPRGRGAFDDSLTDAWRRDACATWDRHARALARFAPARLAPDERVSHEVLSWELGEARAYCRSRAFETARRLPIDHFQGLHVSYALDAAGSGDAPYATVADYDAALVRAGRFAAWVDAAIGRLREGVATGAVLPRMVVERLLPQLERYTTPAPRDSEFWRPIAAFPAAIPAADRERLTAAYERSISTVVQPAYRRLHDYLRDEYLAKSRPSDGLVAIPGGRELYAHLVRHHTTTDLTPERIHAIGLAEVDRLMAELAGVQRTVGFQGSLAEFIAHVQADPAQKLNGADELLGAYRAARADIEGRLPKLFAIAPKAPYEIRALPESSQASQGNGHYSAPAADGSRPGILWMNPYAPGVRDRYNVETISLHEGLPGHHFQLSLAQEVEGLPAFRRFDSQTAFVEGWGLYAESLGRELGMFGDPMQYYGHLNYALLRANRLVIDTGIHALGWDRARGTRFLVEHSSLNEEQARAEVERYVAYPGQALAYKVGELAIRGARRRAEQALGARFDVRAFHSAVLLGGSLPLAIFDREIDRWIAVQRAQR